VVFHVKSPIGHERVHKRLELPAFGVLQLLLDTLFHLKVNLLVVYEAEIAGDIVHKAILDDVVHWEGVHYTVVPDELEAARLVQSHTTLLVLARLLSQEDNTDKLFDWVVLLVSIGYHLVIQLLHDGVLRLIAFLSSWGHAEADETYLTRS
jgi:hypothetical protein